MKLSEILLPKRWYSNLNMKAIAYADNRHAKGVWKNFEIKTLGNHYDLYVWNNTVLLVDVLQI